MPFNRNVIDRINDLSLDSICAKRARNRLREVGVVRIGLDASNLVCRFFDQANEVLSSKGRRSKRRSRRRNKPTSENPQATGRRIARTTSNLAQSTPTRNTSNGRSVKGNEENIARTTSRTSKNMGNEITELVGDIKSVVDEYVQVMFKGKKVTHLPALPIELKLADGWRSELLYCDEVRDTWLCKGDAGKMLPEHFHPDQNKIITVVEGRITVMIGSEPTELSVGQSMEIPKGKRHEIIVGEVGDAEMIFVYQPPLAKEPEYK